MKTIKILVTLEVPDEMAVKGDDGSVYVTDAKLVESFVYVRLVELGTRDKLTSSIKDGHKISVTTHLANSSVLRNWLCAFKRRWQVLMILTCLYLRRLTLNRSNLWKTK